MTDGKNSHDVGWNLYAKSLLSLICATGPQSIAKPRRDLLPNTCSAAISRQRKMLICVPSDH